MAGTYHLSILTPDGESFSGDVSALVAPGVLGSFGVLSGHAPMLAAINPGVLRVTAETGVRHFAVAGGTIEISQDRVLMLMDGAVEASSAEDAVSKARQFRQANPEPAFTATA